PRQRLRLQHSADAVHGPFVGQVHRDLRRLHLRLPRVTASLRQMLDGCSYATLKEWGLLKICPRWLVAAVETNELVRVRCCVARRSPVAAHVSHGRRISVRESGGARVGAREAAPGAS